MSSSQEIAAVQAELDALRARIDEAARARRLRRLEDETAQKFLALLDPRPWAAFWLAWLALGPYTVFPGKLPRGSPVS